MPAQKEPKFRIGQSVALSMTDGSTMITVPLPNGDMGDWVKVTVSGNMTGTIHKVIIARKHVKYQVLFTFPSLEFAWTVYESALLPVP